MKKLEGYKTYGFLVLFFVAVVLQSQGLVPEIAEKYMTEVYAFLLAGAGISLRQGMKTGTK